MRAHVSARTKASTTTWPVTNGSSPQTSTCSVSRGEQWSTDQPVADGQTDPVETGAGHLGEVLLGLRGQASVEPSTHDERLVVRPHRRLLDAGGVEVVHQRPLGAGQSGNKKGC